ncbi:MAG: hypothetical protein A3H39_13215 [candidate division NC10 bacterium RIFCSPLOWO2_02_FULL_66_22]|nr:MAG: hypothetical protein A3H39_13215 [candidate division NC10 bacterium RIFCSPLOWO2_02_FULL_66_22]
MYYLIISRHCAKMQQELAPALQGRKDIRVILDRRHGEQIATERRRKDRRRPPDMLLGDRAAEGA